MLGQCSKCNAPTPPAATECPTCGVIFAKIRPEGRAAPPEPELTTGEAAFIDGAVEDGIEFGLETLPAKIRDKVDVQAATALAKRRLANGVYRQNLAAFDESIRGIEAIVEASSDPPLAVLRDPELLARMFGLNARQAATIIRETSVLVENGKKLEAVRRVMRKRIREALEARAEMIGKTLAQEAISTAQQAVFEASLHQGILKEGDYAREWENQEVEPCFAGIEDEQVCPRCVAFHGKRAPLMEPFVSDAGESAWHPGIHPGCRCKVRLVQLP